MGHLSAPVAAILLWPVMLPWLALTALPLLLAWWALRHARMIRWGAIDLVARAARAAGISRSGMSVPLVVARSLLLGCAALAATRPFFAPSPPSPGTQLVAGDGARRIELVAAGAHEEHPAGSSLAMRRAIEALARSAPWQQARGGPPAVDLMTVADAGAVSSDRRLIIICDGAVPATDAADRIAAAVRAGASLLVCLGPDAVGSSARPRLSSWLEDLAGIAVAGSVAVDDDSIDVRDPDRSDDGFVVLPGPRVDRAADLFFDAATVTVRARTTAGRRPLLVESAAGNGRVCVAAIPLALAAARGAADASAEWSDLAAWPAFVPFVDRLVTGLLESPAREAAPGPRPRSRFAGLALARPLIGCAIVLALLEWMLSSAGGRARVAGGFAVSPAARAAVLACLAAMFVAWGGRPRERAVAPDRAAPIAVLIDTSPSMATVDAAAPDRLDSTTSRLQAVLDALIGNGTRSGVLDRLAGDRPVAIHAIATDVESLGRYPADVIATDLRALRAGGPTAESSRLGDCVGRLLDEDEPIAAVVIAGDGAITAGASWADATAKAVQRGVALIVVPVGSEATAAVGLPVGFRFTTVDAPLIGAADEPVAISIRGVAATPRMDPLPLAGFDSPGELRLVAGATPSGYLYTGTLAGRLARVPTANQSTVMTTQTITVGDDARGRHDATVPLVVTSEPIRVLLVDSVPRYEFRFLEGALAGDGRFDVTTCLLAARDTSGLRHEATLPRTAEAWKRFDVVVIGDVPVAAAPEADATVWTSLREAAENDGVGIAWLPGRRWREADVGLTGWLPASSLGTAGTGAATHALRLLPSARAAGWLFPGDDEDAGDRPPPRVSGLLSVTLRPTARVLAVAVPSSGDESRVQPAVIIDRLGAATILGHLGETWRWRGEGPGMAPAIHNRYWRETLARLAEPRRLGRLVGATITARPSDPVVGETVRVDVVPAQRTTDLAGWSLDVSTADAPPRQVLLPPSAPGMSASLRLDGLSPGRHRLRLTPPLGAADGLPTAVMTREIIVNQPSAERAAEPAGTGPLEAAVRAGGGAIVPLDRIDTLPATIANAIMAPRDRMADETHWLASRPAAHLLLAALAAVCAIAWWPRRNSGARA